MNLPLRSDVPTGPPSPVSPSFSAQNYMLHPSSKISDLPLESWTIRSEVPLVTPSPRSITIPLESREPSRKALLIGIRGSETAYPELKEAHSDVETMRNLLIDRYHYSPSDIQILIDDSVPGHIQPTRANILSAISELVKDAKAGDKFVFHYSGHTMQIDKHTHSEEDGIDECLIPCDGIDKIIMDSELHKRLVAPLPAGCQLVAVLDTCHSGSVLDLEHYRCNRVAVPWIWRGRRRSNENRHPVEQKSARLFSRARMASLRGRQAALHAPTRMLAPLNEINLNLACAPSAGRLSPGGNTVTYRWCTDAFETDALAKEDMRSVPALAAAKQSDMFEGMMWLREVDCKSNTGPGDGVGQVSADVVSLASCRDSQGTWEDEGKSMTAPRTLTAALVDILRRNPNQSLKDVLISVSHTMYTKNLVQNEHPAASQRTRKECEIGQLRPTMSLRVVGAMEPTKDLTRAPTLRSFLVRRVRELKQLVPKQPRSLESTVELPSALPLDMERQWMM